MATVEAVGQNREAMDSNVSGMNRFKYFLGCSVLFQLVWHFILIL